MLTSPPGSRPALRLPQAILTTLLLVLVSFSPSAAADRGLALASPEALPSKVLGTYHALIIGINDYHEWNPLRTALRDATVLRDVLVKQYGFDEKNVILRTDQEATRLRLIQDLRDLASGLKETDNLLIYFAGHGQLDDLTGDGYWVPVEGKLKNPGTWISHGLLKGVLGSEKVRAKNVVVIADSCYSGTLLRGGPSLLQIEDRSYLEKLGDAAAKKSRQVITSGGLEPVADGGRDGHSLFAYYLIKALRDNDRELVDLENLFHTRVWAPVTQVGDQRPNVGRLKSPMDEDGQFVLLNRGLLERKAAQAAEEARARKQQQEAVLRKEAERQTRLSEERARMEAERKRLEEERLLLEEKRRLEAERLRLAEEKKRLALEVERRELEEEKARMQAQAAPKVASLPKTTLVQRPGQVERTLAILPWNYNLVPDRWHGQFVNATRGHKWIAEFLHEERGFRLTHSTYPWSGQGSEEVRKISLSSEERDSLWTSGLFSRPKPDPKVAAAIGRRLGVDLVFLIQAEIPSEMSPLMIKFYLLETATGRFFTASKPVGLRWYGEQLVQRTREHLQQYLAEASQ